MIAELCRRAGWVLEHEMLVPSDREIGVLSGAEGWQWNVALKEIDD